MGTFIIFTLETSLALLAGYVVYKWLLASQNQPGFNRLVLLAIYALSLLAYPLLHIDFRAAHEPSEVVFDLPMASGAAIVAAEPHKASIVPAIIAGAYISGAVAVLLSTFATAMRLRRVAASGLISRERGYKLAIIHNSEIAPFSWGRVIVMSETDYEESGNVILAHERAHVAKRHFLDLMVAQAFCILMWYNPASWLMLRELRAVHEYQADAQVLKAGVDARDYQYLLIRKAVGQRFPSLANSLNHSKLKNRITMMCNKQTSKGRRWRALAAVPAMALALIVPAIPAVASALTSLEGVSLLPSSGKVSNFPAAVQAPPASATQVVDNAENSAAATDITEPAPAVATEDAEPESVGMKVDPQEAKTVNANSDNCIFIVDGVSRGDDFMKTLKPDDIASMTVLKQEEAKRLHGYEGDKSMVVIVTKNAQTAAEKSEPAVAVEKMAEYPGGQIAMMNYLNEHIKMPADANGRVIVKFVIDTDGSVTNPTVLKSVSPEADAAAIEALLGMPKWTPAENDGKPVASYFTIPIAFRTKTVEK